MNLATKKFFHNVLAIAVSVCMICTMTPSLAWATSGSGAGVSDNSAEFVGDSGGKATGSTIVTGKVENKNFAFKISGDRNYESKAEFVEAVTGSNPLKATMPENGVPKNYTLSWLIREVEVNPDFDPDQEPSADNPKLLFPNGEESAIEIFQATYTRENTPKDSSKVPTFTYPGDDGMIVEPDDLPMENGKMYEFTIRAKDTDNNQQAHASTYITLYSDYPEQVIASDQNEQISVWGNIYQVVAPGVAVLSSSSLPNTNSTYQGISKEAAKNSEDVSDVIQLQLVNNAITDPSTTPPYEGELEIRLPLPEGLESTNEGATVNVYVADDSGNVTSVEGVIGWTADPNSDPQGKPLKDSEGNDIPAVVFSIKGTSSALGSFAVGIPVSGTYFMTTKAQAGGQISPAGTDVEMTRSAHTFSAYALAPQYLFTSFELTVNDVPKTLAASDIGYNQVTITPAAYGIEDGDEVVLTAKFSNAVRNQGTSNAKLTASLTNEEGAGGTYDVSTVSTTSILNADGELSTVKPSGTSLNNRSVSAGTAGAIRSLEVDRYAGLLLNFRPNDNSYVKSVTIGGKPVAFQGNTLFIGCIGQTSMTIVVTYAVGDKPTVDEKSIQVDIQRRPNGVYPATITKDGAEVGSATYPIDEGGTLNISPQPYKDTYRLSEVLVYSPADSSDSANIVQHVYVSPNDQASGYPPDNIRLFNITEDMRIELVYKMLDATIGGEGYTQEGGEWGWILPDDGAATIVSQSRSAAPARVRTMAAAQTRDADKLVQEAIQLAEKGYARLEVRPFANYEIGNVTINGNRVNSLLTKRGSTYTLTVYRGEAGSAPEGIGSRPTDGDEGPDKIYYINSSSANVKITYNPMVIPAPSFIEVTTAVTAFGGGSITPSMKVQLNGDAEISFFPDEGYKVDKVWLGGESGSGLQLISGDDAAFVENAVLDLANNKLTLYEVTTAKTVQVSFTPGTSEGADKARYTVSASSSAGGSINPSGSFDVYEGANQSFILAPSNGYKVKEVTVDGKAAPWSGNKLDLKGISKNTDVRVKFEPVDASPVSSYTINVKKSGSGTVSPSGAYTVGTGTDAVVSVIPEDGWYVQDINLDYTGDSNNGGISALSLYDKSTFLLTIPNVRANATVTVVFAKGEGGKVPGSNEDLPTPPSTLTIDPGNLIYLPNDDQPGAVLSPSLSELVIVEEGNTGHGNADQTFTVTVMEGYELNDPNGILVSDDNGNPIEGIEIEQIGDGVYTFTVPKEHMTPGLTIEIDAQPKQASTEKPVLCDVEVSCVGDGYVTPGMDKVGDGKRTVQVESGKNQTFNFIPAQNWKLHTVYVDGKPIVVNGNVYTMHNITKRAGGLPSTIEAVFSRVKVEEGEVAPPVPQTYNVSITQVGQSGHGTYSPEKSSVTVIEGSNLTISMDPDNGYKAVAKVNGEEVAVIGNSFQLTNITKNQAVTIEFVRIVETAYHTLTVTSEGPGTTSPTGTSLVVDKSNQNITLIPDDGMRVESIFVNDETQNKVDDVDSSLTFPLGKITENTTVRVKFCESLPDGAPGSQLPAGGKVTYYDVTTSSPNGGGMISPAASQVAAGKDVYLTLMPNNGYELEKVTYGSFTISAGDSRINDNTIAVRVTSDLEVKAYFKKTLQSDLEDFYTLFINAENGTGSGSVSPAGAVSVPAGGSQTITIMPDPGSTVKVIEATNDGKTISKVEKFTGSSYTFFNVTQDMNIRIEFMTGTGGSSVLTHDITATSSINGRVSPDGTTKVADGKNASFSFIPFESAEKKYKLSYVEVDGSMIPAAYIVNNQYIFADVRENHTLHAVFAEESVVATDYVTVNVNPVANGSINPSKNIIVPKGATQTPTELTITPFYGYKLNAITIEGNILETYGGGDVAATNIYRKVSGQPDVLVCRASYKDKILTLSNISDTISVGATFDVGGNASTGGNAPSYVPIGGSTTGGGSTSIGGGGYIEKPGNGASEEVTKPQVTIAPNPGNTIEKIELNYGDGSKEVIDEKGTFEYNPDGYLVNANNEPIDQNGNPANIDPYTGKPTNGVKYPSQGSPTPRPTAVSPKTTEVYENGYLELDAEKVAERGGVDVNVVFRPLDPNNEADKPLIEGLKPVDERDPNMDPNDIVEPPTFYEINASYSGGGRMYPEGRVKVAQDQNMVFQLLPSNGYEIASLTVGNINEKGEVAKQDVMGDVSASRTYTFKNVSANHTLNAVFGFVNPKVVYYDVNATAKMEDGTPVPGGVSPSSATVPQGSDAVVYFFPPDNCKVASVFVNGKDVSPGRDYVDHMYLASDVKEALNVEVTYKQAEEGENPWTAKPIRVTSNPADGNGSVSPSESYVPEGSPQTFYFKPNDGYVADYVIFNGVVTTLKDNPTSYKVTPSSAEGAENNLAVYFREATFKDKEFTTITPVVNNGQATIDPRSLSAEVGGSAVFYVYPADGYTIKDVKVDGWDAQWKPALPEGQAALNGKLYSAYIVTIDDVHAGANVEVNMRTTNSDDGQVIPVKQHTMTITGENMVSEPYGRITVPEGGQQTITVNPLSGYYLDSIMVKQLDGSGGVISQEEVTHKLAASQLTVPMGQNDIEVYIKYLPVGSESKTPAYITIGSAKAEIDGRMVDVTPSIGLAMREDGSVRGLGLLKGPEDDGTLGKLQDVGGNLYPFIRGTTYTFYATAGEVNGKKLTLQSATFNGEQQNVPELTSMISNVKVNSSGTLDLVFRVMRDDEKPVSAQKHDVKFEVVGNVGGVVSPETVVSVPLGDSITGEFTPASDYWMIGSVVEKRYAGKDASGNEVWTETKIDARRYKDGTYTCTPSARTIVEVTFIECAIVDVRWDSSLGFVAPNPTPGQYLKLPAAQMGDDSLFLVAPYESNYVKDFTVIRDGGETQSYLGGLKQSREAVNYMTAGGLEVVNPDYEGGVVQPTGEAAASNGGISTFAVQMREYNPLPLDPIDYNGVVPVAGTKLENAYEVKAKLHPTRSVVDVQFVSPNPVAQRYTITATAKGNGRIEPSGEVPVRGGQSQSFNFIADNGYVLKRILVDGSPISGSQLGTNGTSYTFFEIDRNHTIEAEFGPMTNDESSRLLRVASRLAQTGDLTGPAVGCLLLVAAIGLAVTAVSYIRRQQRRRRRMQGMR